MKLTLNELWAIRGTINKEMEGINPETGRREEPVKLRLPVSMIRHLRRVLAEVNREIEIAEPERQEFLQKWTKDVDGKKVLPEPENENFSEYQKEFFEMFNSRDFVIAFAPFKLELLDTLDEIIPIELEGLMTELNNEYNRQLEAEKPKTEGENNVSE